MHCLVISLTESLAIVLKRWRRDRRIAELWMCLKVRRTSIRNITTRSVNPVVEPALSNLVI